MTDLNLGEGAHMSVVQAAAELPEQDSENFWHPPKKKMKTMITHDTYDGSDECDPGDQIEETMAPNESEGKNANGDMGSDNEHTLDAIEQDYELESEVGPPIQEQLAKVLTTMAKGKIDAEKIKSKLEKHQKTTKLRNSSGT